MNPYRRIIHTIKTMNKTKNYELTILIPVYNEEGNISALEDRLSVFLPSARRTACVLFIDDGSTDESLGRIREICRRHTDYARRVPFFTGMHRFLPALILLQQGRIKQVPVRHFPRTAGVSKYHLWNRLVSPFIDCFAYRWMKKRYINYRVASDNLMKP